MDEAAILWEFLLFISSSQLFQHSRLCACPRLKAWAMDGSISLHAPPEALYKEPDEKKKKDALISSPACGVMKTSLIKALPLTEPHTFSILTVHFWARSHVGVFVCFITLRAPAVLINYFLLVSSTGEQIQWARGIDPQFAFALWAGCSCCWPDYGCKLLWIRSLTDRLLSRPMFRHAVMDRNSFST